MIAEAMLQGFEFNRFKLVGDLAVIRYSLSSISTSCLE